MWPLRIATSRLRPVNAASITRAVVVLITFAAFLYGDYILFRRLFAAVAKIEEATPFFALGLLKNLLAMVFLIAIVVLFSSAMTAAIGAFFTDLDLEIYHAAPRSKSRIVFSRWLKTLAQSATVVFVFIVPMFIAFAQQYGSRWTLFPVALINLALLLTIPVSLACLVIVLLVRWFPVRRVHQIVATLAILVLTVAVVAFRMSRPERFFASISTDDVQRVLSAIELPSMEVYPGTALADIVTRSTADEHVLAFPARIVIPALALLILFVIIGTRHYFPAFVRARESMAPTALGSAQMTRVIDRVLSALDAPLRGLIGKEVRTLSRDVAQWSQMFLMVALLFVYLYNVRMLPLGGDARATIVAYANLGMAGFVVAAICLRFAYPSVSSEGKAFWLIQSSPMSYRQLLWVKVLVYGAPLTLLALFLTAVANVILNANLVVWTFTIIGAFLLAFTLVSLGVGMGGFAPDFGAENPLQVGLSLGGFAYMAVALAYVGGVMVLMARPIMRYFFWRMFGIDEGTDWISITVPIAIAVVMSVTLATVPLFIAERRMARLSSK